jgi:hypothetical protein
MNNALVGPTAACKLTIKGSGGKTNKKEKKLKIRENRTKKKNKVY